MAITIDWPTKIITVPRADMQLVQSVPTEIRQLDLDAFRLELKDLEDNADGMAYLLTHNHFAPITVGGVTLARVVEIVNGYSVTFEDGQYAVNLVGANSNVADVANVNQVSVRSANSAGLTFSDQINAQSFINASVTLDTSDGKPGTQFPRGTPTDPVDNLSDALAIANNNGLHRILLKGFVVAGATESLDGIEITGGSGAQNIVMLAGASTVNAGFERLIVAGNQDGLARITNCILGATGLGAFTGAEGRFVDCIINSAAGVTQKTTGAGTLFENCAFIAPDDPQVTLDANGKGFGLRNCTGNILVTNATLNEVLVCHISGARVDVAASCTDGAMVFEGHGVVSDNSAGTVVDRSNLIEPRHGREVWSLHGLDAGNPMTVTPTSRVAGGISQTISGDGINTSTVTRT